MIDIKVDNGGDKQMKPNWGMIGVLLIGIGFWTNVWFNGFWWSLFWLIMLSVVAGIWLKIKEDRY